VAHRIQPNLVLTDLVLSLDLLEIMALTLLEHLGLMVPLPVQRLLAHKPPPLVLVPALVLLLELMALKHRALLLMDTIVPALPKLAALDLRALVALPLWVPIKDLLELLVPVVLLLALQVPVALPPRVPIKDLLELLELLVQLPDHLLVLRIPLLEDLRNIKLNFSYINLSFINL